MPEQNKPFVVTDRRKFAMDGTPRPDAESPTEDESCEREPAAAARPEQVNPQVVPETGPAEPTDAELPPPPTASSRSRRHWRVPQPIGQRVPAVLPLRAEPPVRRLFDRR